MNEILLILIGLLVLALQIFVCIKATRLLVKLIPVVAVAALTALCIVLYVLTSNWAWLILCLMVAMMIIPIFLGWLMAAILGKIF